MLDDDDLYTYGERGKGYFYLKTSPEKEDKRKCLTSLSRTVNLDWWDTSFFTLGVHFPGTGKGGNSQDYLTRRCSSVGPEIKR